MRLLLDENLPKRLKKDFSKREIFTIREKGWNGKKNGELLKLLLSEKFDALITFDKNMQYQQNFMKFSITVFVLDAEDNTYDVLKQLIPEIKNVLTKELKPGINPIKLIA